jgi:hypothetical protein
MATAWLAKSGLAGVREFEDHRLDTPSGRAMTAAAAGVESITARAQQGIVVLDAATTTCPCDAHCDLFQN